MQASFGPLIVHPLKTKKLPVVTGSPPPFRPPRRPLAVGRDVDEGFVVVQPGRRAPAPAESAQEFETQASEEWAVCRKAGADNGHGRLQLTPHVRRRQRVCNKRVNDLPGGSFGDRGLTGQIDPLDEVRGNDAHQACHAHQAPQSEDARQHELLACFELQPPDHVQRHAQNDNIKCHVRGCNRPVIRL